MEVLVLGLALPFGGALAAPFGTVASCTRAPSACAALTRTAFRGWIRP